MTHYKKEEGKNGKHLDQKRTIPSLTNETMKRLASSVELQTCRHHRAVLKGLSIANTDRLLLGHSLSPSYVHIYMHTLNNAQDYRFGSESGELQARLKVSRTQ